MKTAVTLQIDIPETHEATGEFRRLVRGDQYIGPEGHVETWESHYPTGQRYVVVRPVQRRYCPYCGAGADRRRTCATCWHEMRTQLGGPAAETMYGTFPVIEPSAAPPSPLLDKPWATMRRYCPYCGAETDLGYFCDACGINGGYEWLGGLKEAQLPAPIQPTATRPTLLPKPWLTPPREYPAGSFWRNPDGTLFQIATVEDWLSEYGQKPTRIPVRGLPPGSSRPVLGEIDGKDLDACSPWTPTDGERVRDRLNYGIGTVTRGMVGDVVLVKWDHLGGDRPMTIDVLLPAAFAPPAKKPPATCETCGAGRAPNELPICNLCVPGDKLLSEWTPSPAGAPPAKEPTTPEPARVCDTCADLDKSGRSAPCSGCWAVHPHPNWTPVPAKPETKRLCGTCGYRSEYGWCIACEDCTRVPGHPNWTPNPAAPEAPLDPAQMSRRQHREWVEQRFELEANASRVHRRQIAVHRDQIAELRAAVEKLQDRVAEKNLVRVLMGRLNLLTARVDKVEGLADDPQAQLAMLDCNLALKDQFVARHGVAAYIGLRARAHAARAAQGAKP